VLDHGTIVESGTHHDLLSRAGTYAHLHDAQNSERRNPERRNPERRNPERQNPALQDPERRDAMTGPATPQPMGAGIRTTS
ncbi:hypothetical protein ACFRKB_32330, partial [Streptomyces scopuliridis]|uniref:hypothetical protein n=1 Tax=Streptomyces scopuliridis TaxID=452529 RepID=UPI0036951276